MALRDFVETAGKKLRKEIGDYLKPKTSEETAAELAKYEKQLADVRMQQRIRALKQEVERERNPLAYNLKHGAQNLVRESVLAPILPPEVRLEPGKGRYMTRVSEDARKLKPYSEIRESSKESRRQRKRDRKRARRQKRQMAASYG